MYNARTYMAFARAESETVGQFTIQRISPSESYVLEQAALINNERWTGTPATTEEFVARATNGIVFGIYEAGVLNGSLSCLMLPRHLVYAARSWNEVSANGTLANHDSNGNTLVCVAISVKEREPMTKKPIRLLSLEKEKILEQLAKQHIKDYVDSGKDPALGFHQKSKGGFPGAAERKIIDQGCPDDIASMGYCVIMEYDIPSEKITFTDPTSPATLLIESGFRLAQQKGINWAIAYSRPVKLREKMMNIMGYG